MNTKNKQVILIIGLLIITILAARHLKTLQVARDMGVRSVSYSYKFRSLSQEDLQQLEMGMSYGELKEILGEPNGVIKLSMGSRPYYELSDGCYISLWFVGAGPDDDTLQVVEIVMSFINDNGETEIKALFGTLNEYERY